MKTETIAGLIEELEGAQRESARLVQTIDQAKHPELMERKRAADAKNEELVAILRLWLHALQPFGPDGEWKGQGWIANARKWIDLVKAQGSAKEMPDFIAAAETDARQFFHRLHDMRDLAQGEAPLEYERFIAEADALADEVRELFG